MTQSAVRPSKSRSGQIPTRSGGPILLAIAGVVLASGCASWRTATELSAFDDSPPTIAALAETQINLAVAAGERAEQEGKPQEAIRNYEQVVMLAPGRADVQRRLAVLYDRAGDTHRARRAYEMAITARPDDADLCNDFGTFHADRGNFADAEHWYRRGLNGKPLDERLRVNLALAIGMQGRFDEALRELTPIVGPAAAQSNLGVLLARQGRNDDARRCFEEALRLDPSLRPAREFLAYFERTDRAPLDGFGGHGDNSATEDWSASNN